MKAAWKGKVVDEEEHHSNEQQNVVVAPSTIYEEMFCKVCGGGEADEQMILCDNCDTAFHLYCFAPPMKEVPEGFWFCSVCEQKPLMVQRRIAELEEMRDREQDASDEDTRNPILISKKRTGRKQRAKGYAYVTPQESDRELRERSDKKKSRSCKKCGAKMVDFECDNCGWKEKRDQKGKKQKVQEEAVVKRRDPVEEMLMENEDREFSFPSNFGTGLDFKDLGFGDMVKEEEKTEESAVVMRRRRRGYAAELEGIKRRADELRQAILKLEKSWMDSRTTADNEQEGKKATSRPIWRRIYVCKDVGVLKVTTDQHHQQLLRVRRNQSFFIGRDSSCDYVVTSDGVCDKHMEIAFKGGGFEIIVHGKSGVYGGQRRTVKLKLGDRMNPGYFGYVWTIPYYDKVFELETLIDNY